MRRKLSLLFPFILVGSTVVQAFVHVSISSRSVSPRFLSINGDNKASHDKNGMVGRNGGAEEESSVPLGPVSEVFFDKDGVCGDSCVLVDYEDEWREEDEGKRQEEYTDLVDNLIRYVPVVAPLNAFLTYEQIADVFDLILDFMSNKNWVAVDGNQYEARIIAPAINGVVVPAIAILFATLISNTVTTLRQRQLDIRTTLNMEAGEIRVLQAMVESFPPGLSQEQCRSYLIQYTSRLIAESQPAVDLNSLELKGSIDSEMNGFLTQLNAMNRELARSSKGSDLPSSLLSETYGAVTRLNSERSTRISALESTFPALHYIILSSLAGSLCVVFLMETNQDILIFLNAIQLKILWTMLIGTFSALAVVCYDLQDPFRGSYQILQSVDQLYTIRRALCAQSQLARAAREDSQYSGAQDI